MYDKVYRADILGHAYALACANKGSAGIDGVTFEAIEENEGVAAFIAALEESLRSKTYHPDPVKRVMIPKSDGSQRPLGKGRKTRNYYPHVQPSKKSLQTIKDRVTNLTRRERTIMPLDWIVNEVNATVRGWVGYFHYRNCCKALGQIRCHVEERLITHPSQAAQGQKPKGRVRQVSQQVVV